MSFVRRALGAWCGLALPLAACQGTPAEPAAAVPDAGACTPGAAPEASQEVLTQHNDNARTGATLGEVELDSCTVPSLVELGHYDVDGEVYAQPLYVHDGERNLLLIATMHSSLFAFDADRPGSEPLWQLGRDGELGAPAFSARNIGGNNGILATPVIDRESRTVFLVARDCDPAYRPEAPHCVQRLFAIAVADGRVLSDVVVEGNAGGVAFDPSLHWARAALLLQSGRVFVSFAAGPNGNAHEEDFPFHGWLFGYDAADLTSPPSVYCSTPELGGGAIWQSGNGPAADEEAVYFATGNGIHQPTPLAPSGFPEQPRGDEDSLVRVPLDLPSSLRFWDDRPYHDDGNVFQYMEKNDIDLGTSGPLLIPGTAQLVVAGKSGIVYVLDRRTLALTQPPLEPFHSPPLAEGHTKYIYSWDGGPHMHGSPVFAHGKLFYWPAYESLTAFSYDQTTGELSEQARADTPRPESGGMLALSSGVEASSAVVWAASQDAAGGGHLWAFSATTLERLWDTPVPAWAKFAVPTVAAGRVFLASTSNRAGSEQTVRVFGLPR